jgi:hypothetical protein
MTKPLRLADEMVEEFYAVADLTLSGCLHLGQVANIWDMPHP